MSVSTWTEADTTKANELWADYQRRHDLSERKGETVGIDPMPSDSGLAIRLPMRCHNLTRTACQVRSFLNVWVPTLRGRGKLTSRILHDA